MNDANEYRQFADLDELAGKTILRAVDNDDTDRLLIVFTDRTFLYIKVDVGYERGEETLSLRDVPETMVKVKAGVATDAETIAYREREAMWRRSHENNERAEYERLRAKFEGGPTS